MIKCVIFDFDGVIENTYEFHFSQSQKQITGLTREEHRRLFEGNIIEEKKKIQHRINDYDLKANFDDVRANEKIKIEICRVLFSLSERFMLGIISSSTEKSLQKYVQVNRLDGLFAFIYGSETHRSKEEKFKIAMEKFNLSTNELIFVTDTLGDILEANKLHIKSIAVDFGYHEAERLKKGNPFAIISHFQDLPQAIEKIQNK